MVTGYLLCKYFLTYFFLRSYVCAHYTYFCPDLSRGQDERTGQSGELIKIDLEDVEDDERQYLRRKRDGSLIERKQMVRQDVSAIYFMIFVSAPLILNYFFK